MELLHQEYSLFLSVPLEQYELTAPHPAGHQNCRVLSKDRAVRKSYLSSPFIPLTYDRSEKSKVQEKEMLKTE